MICRRLRLAAVLLVSLPLAGCYTDYGPVAASPEPVLNPTTVAIRLQQGDALKIVVYGEEALTGSYTINPAGEITMPLVGRMKAAGLTKSELERQITNRYSNGKYLQDPKVTVDVTNYRPIYVLGEVLRPGSYPYTAELNVLTAITVAGGFTYRGSRNSVFIQHPGQVVWQEYPLSASVAIAPGDLIRVPERYF
jgi:protein involved in polysaccharide export with SLBB domain